MEATDADRGWFPGDFMQTYTGLRFYPGNPQPDQICIEDIAHGLSMTVRYGGHCKFFYTVAEHCCHLHDAAPEEFQMWALMHDAAEAYLGDIPRPLKLMLPDFKVIEAKVEQVIEDKYDMQFSPNEKAYVKNLDSRILIDERDQVMLHTEDKWFTDGMEPLGVIIRGWAPQEAKIEFLERAYLQGIIK